MNKYGRANSRRVCSWKSGFLLLLSNALLSGAPLAFFQVGSAPTTMSQDQSQQKIGLGAESETIIARGERERSPPKRSASVDPFFKGPNFLKVILDPRENNAIMGVPIPDRIPFMVGLEKDTGTRIQLSGKGDWYQDSGFFSKVLTISGEAAGVLEAFSRARSSDDRMMIMNFLVPRSAGGQLIGTGGSSVKEAEQQTGTTIRITEVPNRQEHTVSVKGMTRDIDAVVKWLLDQQDAYSEDVRRDMRDLLTLKYGPHNSESDAEIYIQLTEKNGRWLTGKGGANRMKLRNTFYVFLDFDRQADQTGLRIKGCLGDVEAAHRYILHNLSKAGKPDSRIT
eukprot:TRINITY_DN29930_c0_g2_i1.p1 TRINITY_DN29930_c0_g2~~TRINITY_DN29930_c0_g2_i1.p1  ORF type:complete len:338 (+),score=26.31 TRINITY_DN29930_c0_g2_i1:63-1076(+)